MTAEKTFTPRDPSRTLEWITVLSAAGLDYRLSRDADGWKLHVPLPHVKVAEAELCAYERERFPPPDPPVSEPLPGVRNAGWAAFWFAHTLLLFYIWLGPFSMGQSVHMAGASEAGLVMAGQWWRTLTSMTLHSGPPHLISNMLFILLMGRFVLRELGLGVGLLLILAGGMLGNTVAAAIAAPTQISVGASGMCFAALGIMSTQQTVGAYRHCRRWRTVWPRAWIPMAAGIALLGIMGTAPHTDVVAHAAGFLSGGLLALPFSLSGAGWMPDYMQRLLLITVFVALPAAWGIALL